MGQLVKLDKTGDTKFEWDPSNPTEVEAAREAFGTYRAQGFMAARMENDVAGERITEFDPSAGTILMIPQMRGG